MLALFKRKITASDAGKLGNAVKRYRERAKVRAKCDEMRAKMGLEPVRWPE